MDPSSIDPQRLRQALRALFATSSAEEALHILDYCPALLSDQADAELKALTALEKDVETIRAMEGLRKVLQRCRVVGILRAFAETQLTAEELIDAANGGLTPETYLERKRFRQELSSIIGALAAEGIRIKTFEDIDKALLTRPHLARRLQRFATDYRAPVVPAELSEAVHEAEVAMQLLEKSPELVLSNHVVDLWSAILAHPSFKTASDEFRTGIYSNYGNQLLGRHVMTQSIDDLNHSIDLLHRALETASVSKDAWKHLNNLGSAMLCRFEKSRELPDLDESIRLIGEAIKKMPPTAAERPSVLIEGAKRLAERYETLGGISDLERSIQLSQHAVASLADDSPELPHVLTEFAKILAQYATCTRRKEIADSAISAFRRAVQRTSPGSSAFPDRALGLGMTLANYGKMLEQDEALNEGIHFIRLALELSSPQSPDLPRIHAALGTALVARFERMRHAEDVEEAIELCRNSVRATPPTAPELPTYLSNLAGALSARYRRMPTGDDGDDIRSLYRRICDPASNSGPNVLMNAVRAWGNWALQCKQWHEAVEAYTIGLARGRQLVSDQLLQEQRIKWARALQGMASGAAYAFTKLNQLEDALLTVERGRLMTFNGDSGATTSVGQIYANARPTALVYIVYTAIGGLSLVIFDGIIQAIWLDSLTSGMLNELISGTEGDCPSSAYLPTYVQWCADRDSQRQREFFDAMDTVTNQLWHHVMGPVSARLRQFFPQVSEVSLVPTGVLTVVPLHAAWKADTTRGRLYFLDEFTVSFTPSAEALFHARLAEREGHAERLVLIGEPSTKHAAPLPNADSEVLSIRALFDKSVVLTRNDATRESVLSAIPKTDILHFCGHAIGNWFSPLDAGLLVADDQEGDSVTLTVRDLLEAGFSVGRLATLSACETGVVGIEAPDELIGLPTALLRAGFAGVVASLWSVADSSTALLMQQFYRNWREGLMAPAAALRAAQQWLRDGNEPQPIEPSTHSNFQPQELGTSDRCTPLGSDSNRHPVCGDYRHPFWWASFYMSGV